MKRKNNNPQNKIVSSLKKIEFTLLDDIYFCIFPEKTLEELNVLCLELNTEAGEEIFISDDTLKSISFKKEDSDRISSLPNQTIFPTSVKATKIHTTEQFASMPTDQENNCNLINSTPDFTPQDVVQKFKFISVGKSAYFQETFQLTYPVYFLVKPDLNPHAMTEKTRNLNLAVSGYNHIVKTDFVGGDCFHINEDRTIITLPFKNFLIFIDKAPKQTLIKVLPENTPELLKSDNPLLTSVDSRDGLKAKLFLGNQKQFEFTLDINSREFYRLIYADKFTTLSELAVRIYRSFEIATRGMLNVHFLNWRSGEIRIYVSDYKKLLADYRENTGFIKFFHLDSTLDWYTSNHLFFQGIPNKEIPSAETENNNNKTVNQLNSGHGR